MDHYMYNVRKRELRHYIELRNRHQAMAADPANDAHKFHLRMVERSIEKIAEKREAMSAFISDTRSLKVAIAELHAARERYGQDGTSLYDVHMAELAVERAANRVEAEHGLLTFYRIMATLRRPSETEMSS